MKYCLSILFWLFASPAWATTWYVATTGSDSNTCAQAQNSSTPKLTINTGLACVGFGAGAGAGHTVQVADGTYAETFTSVPSGTSGNPFTLKSQNPLGAVIMPNTTSSSIFYFSSGINQHTVIDGFSLDGVNVNANNFYVVSGTNDITFQNGEIKNVKVGDGTGPGSFQGMQITGNRITIRNSSIYNVGVGATAHFNHAVYWQGSDGLVEGNTIHTVGGFGMQIYSQSQTPVNNVVRNNKIYNYAQAGTGDGIGFYTGSGHLAYNNIVYQTATNGNAVGITVSSGNTAYHNTVYNNGYMGLNVGNSIGATIRNNIAYGNGVNIETSGATNLTNTNNLTTDPSFVNAAGGDFHIQSGSAAKDAGADLGAPYNADYAGVSRPQGAAYDIGAYEFVISDQSSMRRRNP